MFSPVKQSKPKKNPKNQQYYQPEKYFDFCLHSKEDTRRGMCFSPQKHKVSVDIANPEKNQA